MNPSGSQGRHFKWKEVAPRQRSPWSNHCPLVSLIFVGVPPMFFIIQINGDTVFPFHFVTYIFVFLYKKNQNINNTNLLLLGQVTRIHIPRLQCCFLIIAIEVDISVSSLMFVLGYFHETNRCESSCKSGWMLTWLKEITTWPSWTFIVSFAHMCKLNSVWMCVWDKERARGSCVVIFYFCFRSFACKWVNSLHPLSSGKSFRICFQMMDRLHFG